MVPICSGCEYGRSFRRRALTSEKMAVLAPIERASVTTTVSVKPGFRTNWRAGNVRCCPKFHMVYLQGWHELGLPLQISTPERVRMLRLKLADEVVEELGEAVRFLAVGVGEGFNDLGEGFDAAVAALLKDFGAFGTGFQADAALVVGGF